MDDPLLWKSRSDKNIYLLLLLSSAATLFNNLLTRQQTSMGVMAFSEKNELCVKILNLLKGSFSQLTEVFCFFL